MEKLTIFIVNRQISDKMKHLSEGQRYEISALLRAHHTKSEIAGIVGVHKSTITRELKRNCYLGTKNYYPEYAQRKADQRRRLRSINFKKTIPRSVYETARRYIVEEQYSPEQVVGYCRVNGIKMCSHESLYKWIWADKTEKGRECMCIILAWHRRRNIPRPAAGRCGELEPYGSPRALPGCRASTAG